MRIKLEKDDIKFGLILIASFFGMNGFFFLSSETSETLIGKLIFLNIAFLIVFVLMAWKIFSNKTNDKE